MKVQNKDGKGNPWHSDATGEFTSPGGDGSKKTIVEKPTQFEDPEDARWNDEGKDDFSVEDFLAMFDDNNDAIEQEPVEPLEEEQKEEIKEEDDNIEDRTSEAYKKKNKILKQRALNNLFYATGLTKKGKNFELFEEHFNKWDLSNDFLEATCRVFEENNIRFTLHNGDKCKGGTQLYIGLGEYKEESIDEHRNKNNFLHEMGHVFDLQFRDRSNTVWNNSASWWSSTYFYSDSVKMNLEDAIKEEFDTGKYISNTLESQVARQELENNLKEVVSAYSNYVDTNSINYTSNLHNPEGQGRMNKTIKKIDELTEGRFSQLRKNIDAKYEDQIKNIRASLTSNVDAETYLKNLKDLNDLVANKAMYCNEEIKNFLINEVQKISGLWDYDFKKDFENELSFNISRFREATIFRTFSTNKGLVELSPITDVFKGANDGIEILKGGMKHSTGYYKRAKENTQVECVADFIAAIEENNPLTIGLLKKYFPKTFTIVKEMLEKKFYKKGDKNEK